MWGFFVCLFLLVWFCFKSIPVLLWNQHYFVEFLLGLFPLSRTSEMEKSHSGVKPFAVELWGSKLQRGALWQGNGEDAFHKLI